MSPRGTTLNHSQQFRPLPTPQSHLKPTSGLARSCETSSALVSHRPAPTWPSPGLADLKSSCDAGVAACLNPLAQGVAEHTRDTTHQRHLRLVAALGPLALAVELGAHTDPGSPKHALARGHTSWNGQGAWGCWCGWGRRAAAGDIVTRSNVATLHCQPVDLGIAADLREGPSLGGPSWHSPGLWMIPCGRQTVAGTR